MTSTDARTGSLTRRQFLGVLTGGATIGVAIGYTINRATTRNNPTAASLARMTVYLGTSSEVLALNASTGAVRWVRPLITSRSLAVGSTGVYAATYDGKLYALDPATGRIKWSRVIDASENTYNPFPTTSGNLVYIALNLGYTYAFDADTGHLRWRRQTGSIPFDQSPVVYDGIVYVGSPDSYVYAMDALTGEFRWRFGKGGQSSQDLVGQLTVAQNILFAEDFNNNLYALNPGNGKLQGVYPTSQSSLPCANGIAYTGSLQDGSLQAKDIVRSKVLWTRRIENAEWSSAAISGKVVYFGIRNEMLCCDGNVRNYWGGKAMALDAATGTPIWSTMLPDGDDGAPVVAAGIVYVTAAWNLYALDGATGEIRWIYTTPSQPIDSTVVVSTL